MRRLRVWHVALVVVLAMIATVAILYIVPSNHYVYLPDKAQPANPLVTVPGDKRQSTADGIYMVDVIVRRASILERLFPGIDNGATLVPEADANPLGVSDQQRRESSLQDMTRSQQVAAAVALKSLGYKVRAVPNGVEVNQVAPHSPADGQFEIGDVIVRVDGKPIKTTVALQRYMTAHVHPGDTVHVSVDRGHALKQLRLRTEASPTDRDRAVFGILVQQDADIKLPVKVSINAGNIGGPSAGLAFALDIVDELGPDIDHGRKIVATGEIGLDGSVGPIGGIKQKTIGAREAGADLFIVPKENAPEARKYADGLRIVAVTTFAQALASLKTSA